ncbi:putative epoxide hydrolase [Lentithecium fluviatile CBS 122367]|uniref:Putative epoxide hydrolase n=1 Tax=Lentithecium fluviatile CBS 122367 TaxID=1168545 RepID=A0A6G1ILN1_9PLEO|nr:putative epoxide hydrolase [Lentithecium fluviatile CBS 122367]
MAVQLFPHISKSLTLEDGTTYAYIFIRPSTPDQPTFLLLHGFPSSSFDWRYVIPLLQKEGYGIIAPDLLGYGDTDKPTELSSYSMKRMADHLEEIIRMEHVQQVVGVGHDFGSVLLSYTALEYPSMFYKVVFSAVGYVPPGPFDIDQFNAMTESILGYPTFGYWKFHDEDDAGTTIDANPDSFRSLWYPQHPEVLKANLAPIGAAKSWITSAKVTPLPTWLSEIDAEKRKVVFKRGGYTAPLNWYKAVMRHINESYAASFTTEQSKQILLPALLVVGKDDYVCVPDFQKPAADAYLPDHRIERLECGHWIPLEKPAEFVALLEGFARQA